MIKSIGYDQQEIINNILILHNHGRSIDFDPCYNIGSFYKSGIVSGPRIKSDINPQSSGVLKLDVRNLPFKPGEFKSVMFDPPFLVSSGSSKYKMCQRYGSFETLDELKQFYQESLISLQRVLKHGGLLIFKCQDFVHARQQNLILPFICQTAGELNFAVRDLFVLLSKGRLSGSIKKQQHARKHHCYFLVLKCNKRSNQNE